MAAVLTGRPDFDRATHWGWYWVWQYAGKLAPANGHSLHDLSGPDAVRGNYFSWTLRSDYISCMGHGSAEEFTGQDFVTIFKFGDEGTAEVVKGRHFNLLSCSTGKELAPWMVIQQAKGVHAYTNVYTWVIETKNWPNGHASWFFDAHGQVDKVLLEGGNHGEAHRTCKDAYQAAIDNPDCPEMCKPYLLDNMNGKVFFGNELEKLPEGDPPEDHRGLPAETTFTITVIPSSPDDPEPVVLIVTPDKSEYRSRETVTLTGSLKCEAHDVPLGGRELTYTLDDKPIGSFKTEADGSIDVSFAAPVVAEKIDLSGLSVFAGDPAR